jgi:hypothetical protein
MVVKLPAGRSGVKSLERARALLFSITSKPVLRPTQPLIQWIPGMFCWGLRSREVNLRSSTRIVYLQSHCIVYDVDMKKFTFCSGTDFWDTRICSLVADKHHFIGLWGLDGVGSG